MKVWRKIIDFLREQPVEMMLIIAIVIWIIYYLHGAFTQTHVVISFGILALNLFYTAIKLYSAKKQNSYLHDQIKKKIGDVVDQMINKAYDQDDIFDKGK